MIRRQQVGEPNYNFFFAVVREFTPLGFELRGIHLFYNPNVPLNDQERRSWCKNPEVLSCIPDFLESFANMRAEKWIHLRKDGYNLDSEDLGTYILWGIVPILSIVGEERFMRKIRSLYSPHDFHFFLDTPFIKEHKLEKWFSDLCTELQKKGGAKYLIINQKRGETPRWAI